MDKTTAANCLSEYSSPVPATFGYVHGQPMPPPPPTPVGPTPVPVPRRVSVTTWFSSDCTGAASSTAMAPGKCYGAVGGEGTKVQCSGGGTEVTVNIYSSRSACQAGAEPSSSEVYANGKCFRDPFGGSRSFVCQ